MNDLRNTMKLISGTEPTPEQIARVSAIAHSLDIPKNDALFPILVALDQYHGVFSELPQKMNTAADAAAKEAAAKTAHHVNIGLVAAINSMGPQIGNALVAHAKAINQVDKAKWIGGVVVVVALLFSAFGWAAHASGYASGLEAGKIDGSAAAVWSNTDQGRLAQELAEAGSLELLAKCGGKSWKVSKGVCYPNSYSEDENRYVIGWKVGNSADNALMRKIK